jgi:hypothetical protein
MAPLRRHRTRPRVIRPEQAHAEGLRFIHLGFPWRRRLRRGPSQERRPRSGFAGLALTRSTRGRHRVGLAGGPLLAAVAGVSALGTVMAGALPRLEAFHRLPDAAPRLPLLPRGGGWRARPLVGWRVDCLKRFASSYDRIGGVPGRMAG